MTGPVRSIIHAFGALTDSGPSRPVNEDAYLVVPERALFGVADGYGGQGIGDVAAKKVLEHVRYFLENGLNDSEVTLPFVYRTYYTAGANLVFNAFLYANQQLVADNASHPINARAGVSALFAFFQGRHMTLANVGVCGAMLVRRGRMQPLVKPRSYNGLRGSFQGSWNAKWAFPLASIGHARDLEPEIVELQVEKGDMLILATDGVYPRLTEEDFSHCFSILTMRGAIDLAIKEQNQRLIDLAQAKGNLDNQAVISMICA